jgi:hypothetical protein
VPHLSQLRNPFRVRAQGFLEQRPVDSVSAQLRAHAQRALAARRMVCHEILRETPVIEQLLGPQRIEQGCDHPNIVTFIEQLTE